MTDMLAMQENLELMMPDPIGVAHDVNQAIYDTLTPDPIAADLYDLCLVPQEAWGAGAGTWTLQLTAIFKAVREKYPVLPHRPTPRDIAATLNVPLSTTHQLIVGRIFSPQLRHAFKRKLLAARRGSSPKRVSPNRH